MSRHHKRRRLAVLAACAGSTATIAALASAGSALATVPPPVPCATPGFANGSSLQGVAQQEVWLTAKGWGGTGFKEFQEKAETAACEKAPFSSGGPEITYTKTSSGAGLEEFGNNDGELHPKEDTSAIKAEGEGKGIKDAGTEGEEGDKEAGKVLDWYVGTDDPPNAGELGEATVAAGAKHITAEITIPVTQAPVAVMLSLPAGCKVEAGSKLDVNNVTVGQLWEGLNKPSGSDPGGVQKQGGFEANTWGAFLTQIGAKFEEVPAEEELLREVEIKAGEFETQTVKVVGGGCKQEIIPQARFTESGTSYAFKNYNAQVNHKEWAPFADDFQNWPSVKVVLEDPNTSGNGVKKSESGGNLAENAAATPGAIGYANTADAFKNGGFSATAAETSFGTGTVKEGGKAVSAKSIKHQILWAQIQDNGIATAGAKFVDPLTEEKGFKNVANCEATSLVPSDQGFPENYNGSWFGIAATDPNIAKDAGAGDYPICALTYDLAFHHYQVAHLFGKTKVAEEVANSTHNALEYITTEGQTQIAEGHFYQRFPKAFAGKVGVAVKEIKF
jgi:hypothetical protein